MITIETVLRVNGQLMTATEAKAKALDAIGEFVDGLNKGVHPFTMRDNLKVQHKALDLGYWQMVVLVHALANHSDELVKILAHYQEVIATQQQIDDQE